MPGQKIRDIKQQLDTLRAKRRSRTRQVKEMRATVGNKVIHTNKPSPPRTPKPRFRSEAQAIAESKPAKLKPSAVKLKRRATAKSTARRASATNTGVRRKRGCGCGKRRKA